MRFLKINNIFESQALKYLKKQGLKLIAQNYYCKLGEIDLLMLDKGTLVIVEVRYRKNANFGTAEATVDSVKQKKIMRTLQFFLIENRQWKNHPIRFDVFAITGDETNWIKQAF